MQQFELSKLPLQGPTNTTETTSPPQTTLQNQLFQVAEAVCSSNRTIDQSQKRKITG
ncbi:hypothetical protein MJO28_016431 [Puccinia striiformis f. sp. tritici]|uniref:Uncharacterized protein n=1 Tax=Puccinia striiformis f. sp. tritici TaxID=168172 RepID=A0ACC0DN87_9BASI|nr:hypothetical protein MJO29_016202 [Puccinia striiformis f. sp. tritici]KAI7935560.1 hypothetical protein MJO28_016431 [Puccinia striiformis f. sp. tritici]